MPITHEHQIALLVDILRNHHTDCCGAISECEQVNRLVELLMTNTNVHNDVKTVLSAVHQYGKDALVAADLNKHIHSHQEQLATWVDEIH